MNTEHLYDPVGDVLANSISRELPVRLTDLERLELADRKAAAEDELAAHQHRMAEVRREIAKQGEAIAKRIVEMGTALRERQERRVVVCEHIAMSSAPGDRGDQPHRAGRGIGWVSVTSSAAAALWAAMQWEQGAACLGDRSGRLRQAGPVSRPEGPKNPIYFNSL